MLTITVKSRKDLKEHIEQSKYNVMIFTYFVELIKYGTSITILDCYKDVVFEINEKNVLESARTNESLKMAIITYINEIFMQSILYVEQEQIIKNTKQNHVKQYDKVVNEKELTYSPIYMHKIFVIFITKVECELHKLLLR